MTDEHPHLISRRAFVQASFTSLILAGCSRTPPVIEKLPTPTEVQKSSRRKGPSTVGILRAPSYSSDLFAIIKNGLSDIGIPDCKNKLVVLKPNLIECPDGKPVTTRPEVLKAVIQLVDHLGAKEIIVAEGAGHMRDTDYILAATGTGAVCKQMGIQFIDLNLDDLVKVPITQSFSRLEHFYLPKTIMDADVLVNLPKMKTHHWMGITAAMKNMFGIIPGREYGFPKSTLHVYGIPQCMLDLNRLVKSDLIVVDGIIAMEGDGPVNGTARDMGLIIVGNDAAAVDATCARIMGFKLDELDYMKVAGEVIGNVEPDEIRIVGCPIKDVATKFERPLTYVASSTARVSTTAGGG